MTQSPKFRMHLESWLVLLNSVVALITAIVVLRGRMLLVQQKDDIRKIEVATNSMKDALVKATADSQFAAGREEARIEGVVKAATLAEGKLQAETDVKPKTP